VLFCADRRGQAVLVQEPEGVAVQFLMLDHLQRLHAIQGVHNRLQEETLFAELTKVFVHLEHLFRAVHFTRCNRSVLGVRRHYRTGLDRHAFLAHLLQFTERKKVQVFLRFKDR
jgi:hypothetical protein